MSDPTPPTMQTLEKRLAQLEQQNETLVGRTLALEQEVADLSAQLTVVTRLHEAPDREDVVRAIEEIVNGLIGSEELAVLEISGDGKSLTLLSSQGVPEAPLKRVTVGEGAIGEAAAHGTTYIGGGTDRAGLTACVPLRIRGRTVGAVAIFGLLPQKSGLEERDLRLLRLLSAEAGVALHHSRSAPTP